MRYTIITLFPEIFDSFVHTSLIHKACQEGHISIDTINPRIFCTDKHTQVDDYPYGGGAGLLVKAQPVIDALNSLKLSPETSNYRVTMLSPSPTLFTQAIAHEHAQDYDHHVLICGRYEGIDHRVLLRCQQTYGERFGQLSMGKYVLLGGEVPAMAYIEATARLLPGVIGDAASRQDESYQPDLGGSTIEYPQYTRPVEVEDMEVPEVLLSGHHAAIEQWRKDQTIDGNAADGE